MQSADILLDINETSILSTDFHKISNTKFHKNPFTHKPTDTYGQIWRSQQPSLNTLRTHTNDLQATSHTFTHNPSSNMAAVHSDTCCHLSVSILLLLNCKHFRQLYTKWYPTSCCQG